MISHQIKLTSINSTNDYLHDLIRSGKCEDGTLVIANEQTAGRGLSDNIWESESGKNLTLSIFHIPDYLPPADQFMLNITVSLAVREFVAAALPKANVTVKWPNDVYIDDGKVAGILIQNGIIGDAFSYSIIGIGINVNQESFLSGAPNPVSLIHYTFREFDLNKSLQLLINCIDEKFALLQTGHFEKLRDEYLWNLYRLGKWFGYKINGIFHIAKVSGITNFGQLMLRDSEEKDYVCDLKEVEFLL